MTPNNQNATHFVSRNWAGAVFVKEAFFFKQQGGLTESWGKAWRPVIAASIDDARKQASEFKYNLYLASSWRNPHQELVLTLLRGAHFSVYDFKNPSPNDQGFSWKEIDAGAENWTTEQYISILDDPIAERGFQNDWSAMQSADACVLLLPCGRSAHIEAGWFVGVGKPLFIYIPDRQTEPELMYKMSDGVFHKFTDLLDALNQSS